jgi:hypothetical protein
MRLLLDEHYPPWLRDGLVADGHDVVCLTADWPDLRGCNDDAVLQAAAADRRIVVTEDVATFGVAIDRVPGHVGVIYCLASRFPRTRPGLNRLRQALGELAANPPPGLGADPLVLWLQSPG